MGNEINKEGEKDIGLLLTLCLVQSIVNSTKVKIKQLNVIISLLIKAGIPFDVSFKPGTRRQAPKADITIFISPAVSITLTLTFDSC